MRPPAFQFYPADYLASQRVQMLTLEEEGAYVRLLAYCWLHGTIPADPEQVAKLIGKGASTTLATTVLTMFQADANRGVMIHDRLERERLKQEEWRAKSAAGGRKSGEMRKGGSKGGSTVVQPPKEPKGNTTSSSTSTNTEYNITKGGDAGAFPTLPEVLAYAPTVMAKAEWAEAFWNANEAAGWVTKHGHPVADWRPLFRNWATSCKANEARDKQANGHRKPASLRDERGQRPGEIPTDVTFDKMRSL